MLEFIRDSVDDKYYPFLRIGDIKEDVTKWSVAWMTPKGILLKLEDALAWARETDMDPNYVLRPVVMARTNTDYEVFP